MSKTQGSAYAQAGVDIDKKMTCFRTIKKLVKTTAVKGVLSDIGYFGVFQTSGVFPSATWLAVTNTPYYSNNQWSLTFPVTDPAAYYRLAAP